MIEYCPRCGGELTEMPTNHYAKKILACERCRKEDLKRLLNISDESPEEVARKVLEWRSCAGWRKIIGNGL
jgi:reverse gyrase